MSSVEPSSKARTPIRVVRPSESLSKTQISCANSRTLKPQTILQTASGVGPSTDGCTPPFCAKQSVSARVFESSSICISCHDTHQLKSIVTTCLKTQPSVTSTSKVLCLLSSAHIFTLRRMTRLPSTRLPLSIRQSVTCTHRLGPHNAGAPSGCGVEEHRSNTVPALISDLEATSGHSGNLEC